MARLMACCPIACKTEVFRKYFVDLRVICVIMCAWLLVVIVVFVDLEELSKTDSDFFHFGPRTTLVFFHTPIDTHAKYNALICLIVAHTAISDCLSDSLNPHVLTIVQNRTNRYLPHSKAVYYLITSIWGVYCSVSALFTIYLALGQIDLLLVRLLSDIMANFFTMNIYMKGKVHDLRLYNESIAHETSTTARADSRTEDDVSIRSDNHLIRTRDQMYSIESSDDECCDNNASRQQLDLVHHSRPVVVAAGDNYYAVQDVTPRGNILL